MKAQRLVELRRRASEISANLDWLGDRLSRMTGFSMCDQCKQLFDDYKAIQFPTDGIILCPCCYDAIVVSDESVPQAVAKLKAEKSKQ